MKKNQKFKESERKRPYRVNVRLNEEEWNRLKKDQLLTSWEKATILRETYMRTLPAKLTFDKEGEKSFLAEFRRIGNNINQIARALNMEEPVAVSEMKSVKEQLEILFRYVMRMDGVLKNTQK